jgi:hypothetical protein
LAQLSAREIAWHGRPRVYPSQLEEPEVAAQVARTLGSNERVALFRKLAEAYQADPNLENYLRIRQEIPEVEFPAEVMDWPDEAEDLGKKLAPHGIESRLIAGMLDVFEPDIDELCLRLMECLVSRRKLPKTGPGHITNRRAAISDTLVNYCIVMILQSMATKESPPVIPSSLIVLIRDRLCGPAPDLHKAYLAKQEQAAALRIMLKNYTSGSRLSARKLGTLAGVSKSKAARWLAEWNLIINAGATKD